MKPESRLRFATHSIAAAIADEIPVDWLPAERALGADAPALARLRLLDDVARAFRSNATDRPHSGGQSLFRWGHLEVHERLGQGLTGEVLRAWDPTLQRDVALKLRVQRDPLSDPANAQLIAEARQLARIRHRNILSIYGAAVHDERAGIWCELIDGRTLAEIVAVDGPLGATETLHVGLDLCRALTVVHQAGLVHGDIKAENVMRERGGRIVLMDFGSSGESVELAGRRLLRGTPRYLAPELIQGATPDPGSDLYALAMLLYHLLTGAFARDEAGDFVPLLRRRSDLPMALCALIDRCLDSDPKRRPASVAALAGALIEHLPDAAPAKSSRRARVRLAAALLILTLATTALLAPRLAPVPWQVQAQFLDAGSGLVLGDGTPVRVGDRLRLRLQTSRPSHVFVLNEDSDGVLSVLFPIAGLELDNPLPGGRSIELPGQLDGESLAWEISHAAELEEFVLIAASTPLPALADRLTGRMAAHLPEPSPRSAGRLQRTTPAAAIVRGTALAELIEIAEQARDPRTQVHIEVLRLPHAGTPTPNP